MIRHSLMVLALILGANSNASAADWTNEWFNTVTVTGPSSFEGQKRGYLNGGQISARFNMGTDNLVSVSLPRANTSCGGIDLFAGGVSFLDPEYLVSKLENILQAAPAMAFNMALKAHCQQCEDIMTKLEAMSTYLNSIQVNDCRMANQVARFVTGDDPDVFGNILMEATGHRSLRDGLEKNYKAAQDKIDAGGGAVDKDLRKNVESCPAPIRELFADGSVIANAAGRVGMANIADLVRGHVGDVIVSWPAGQNVPAVRELDACPSTDRYSAEDFLEGRAQERPAGGGACVPNSTISIINLVNGQLTSISSKIAGGAALTVDEVAFINQSSEPVWALLKTAVYQGTVSETIAAHQYPIAAALAYRVYDDLLRNTEYLIDKAISDASTIGIDGSLPSTEPCYTE
ncbi:MAG: conjugal transfer protein TraH, partial [Pseudomonadota bacterium]